jgi:hypothetical protein
VKQIICSFSGGETSGYMAKRLKEEYPDTVFIFANTGQENEETLEFVNECDKAFGLSVVWIEAVINPIKGKGSTYRVTNFKDADRTGRIFDEMMGVYGLPNPAFPHCSRETKTVPMTKWANDNFDSYEMAIGIREDELDRINPNYKEKGLIYPLAFKWPTTKNEINRWWRDMPFRLNLKHYQGNCKWCYKKAFEKLAWIAKETPEVFDFPEAMEDKHRFSGNRDTMPKEGARIFRNSMTVKDIRAMSLIATEPADESKDYNMSGTNDIFGFKEDLDMCGSESCEAF